MTRSARFDSKLLVAEARFRAMVAGIGRKRPRRSGGTGPEPDGVPVDPNRPKLLDGGASAALTFDD